MGIDELKMLHILHTDFPRTLPDFRRAYVDNHVCLHMPAEKNKEEECEQKFLAAIPSVLSKYSNVFNTSIRHTMNVPDAELNLAEGYRPTRCYTCRPTSLHYMETADKLLADLMAQGVIEEAGDTRSEWCSPADFMAKAKGVPLVLCLVCDFTGLNSYLTRDQPATFPTGHNIRKQLGPECKVWACLDALSAYYQVKI